MRTPLTAVDSAWLRMDDPTSLMVVTGLMVLDEPVSYGRVKAMLETRLCRFPRFLQRIVEPPVPVGTPSWEDDPTFVIENHLLEVELPPPGDEKALQALVSSLMSQPFNPAEPLWRFYFVPRYLGGSAIISRIHHCIGDGLALIYVMLSMADGGPEPPPAVDPPVPDVSGDDDHASAWEALGRAVGSAAGSALSMPFSLASRLADLVGDPEKLNETTGQAAASLSALAKLLLLEPDPATCLKGPLVAEKKVAWSHPIPIDELRRVGRVTGATINDILAAALAGALRRYVIERGDQAGEGLNVRGVVPVNLRPLEEAHQLGNQFGLVFLSLPVGIADPLDRLFEVRRRMREIKNSPEAFVAFQILKALGVAPKQIFDVAINEFGRKGSAVVTNVIGPREPISMAGARMRQAMFWVPVAGRLGLGVSLLSYAGEVWVGVQSDVGLIPDPGRILDAFYAEIDDLVALAAQVGK